MFLGGGGGASRGLAPSFRLEARYRWACVPNRWGLDASRQAWKGRGVSIGIQHAVGRPRGT
jgi:hypothetical protein